MPLAVTATLAVALALIPTPGAGAPAAPAAATSAVPATAAPAAGATADDDAVTFTAAGDYGATSRTEAVLRQIDDLAPDLNLALGDLSYGKPGGERRWCDLVTQHVGTRLPFQLLAGNHEADGRNGHIDRFAECLPNRLPGMVGSYGRQWYADVPAGDPLVRFVMVSAGTKFDDGVDSYAEGSDEYAWTEAAIDGARAADIPWVVVGVHKPCLSMGEYGCDSGRDLHDLLIDKRVDLVLQGHEHLYQRTKQLAVGPGCGAVEPGRVDRDCIVDADAQLVRGAGTVFATVGTGGTGLRRVHRDDPEAGYFAASAGSDGATWGALSVRATGTKLTARFDAASGGAFQDSFTIASRAGAPGRPASTPTPRPTAPAAGTRLVADTFGRTVRSGFGTAEVGGRWVTAGDAGYSVGGGVGRITLPRPGAGADVSLPAVASASTDLLFSVAPDEPVTGSGLHVTASARRVPGVGEYRARVQLRPDGRVVLTLARTADGVGRDRTHRTTIPGLELADGQRLMVRTQVTGTDPTRVRARVWRAGTPEPTHWQLGIKDSTDRLQAPGSVGVSVRLSRTARGPAEVLVDDLTVRTP